MPSLGADMGTGVLLDWLVHPGDKGTRGDIIAVVDTAKAAFEVESFETGVIERLLVEPGTSVPVGAPLAVIATATETGGAAMPAPPEAMPGAVEPAPAPVLSTSPLVRRTATEQHLDLTTVHGTGFGGRITRADVDRAAKHAALPMPTPVRRPKRVPVSPIARRPRHPQRPARLGQPTPHATRRLPRRRGAPHAAASHHTHSPVSETRPGRHQQPV